MNMDKTNNPATAAVAEIDAAQHLAEALARKLEFLSNALPGLVGEARDGAEAILSDTAADVGQIQDHVGQAGGLAGKIPAPGGQAGPTWRCVRSCAFEDVRDGLTRATAKMEFIARSLPPEIDQGLRGIMCDLAGDLGGVLGDWERSAGPA